MATATDLEAGLAYDIEGSGTPVVFLHGLTFDRRTWRPIIDRLDGAVTSIAIDLPAHGDSGGDHQIAPMLRGPAFGQVWPNIENSLGLDRIPEPARTLVLDTHKVSQDVVLGYFITTLYGLVPRCGQRAWS
jgi:pimeloyl-ACP methyl ester carboxylesterase